LSVPAIGQHSIEPLGNESEENAGVIANSAWLILSQGIVVLIAGGVSIYAIRNFTTSAWGHYSTALALAALFTVLAGSGLAPLALREMTSSRARQGEILGTTLQALAWTFVVAVTALFATVALLSYPREVILLVLVISPCLILDPAVASFDAAFNARGRLFYVALFQVAQAVVYGAIAVIVVLASLHVVGLAVATVCGSLTAAVLAFVFTRAKLHLQLSLRGHPRRVWNVVRAATPIAGINLVAIVYARVDVVMLSVLSTSTKVAFYTTSYALVRLSWLLPSIISAVFFPVLSRRLAADRNEASTLFFLVARVFFFISIPISLFLALSAQTLVPLIFGASYAPSATVLQVMAWTSVLGFQNYLLWYAMLAARRERAVFLVQFAGLAVNIALNAVAIPLYGSTGAAAALLASDLVVIAGQAILVDRHVFSIPIAELVVKPAAAGIIVIPIAVVIAAQTPIGGALFGVAAYVALLIGLRYITLEEWRPLTTTIGASVAVLKRSGPGT
jgi:O-antigen/teichoic acid export membrane protein